MLAGCATLTVVPAERLEGQRLTPTAEPVAHIYAANWGFVARTPDEMLEFLRAQLPDPATGRPAADALPKFLATHPAAAAFIGRLMQKPIPASYAQSGYHAEHAFRFTAADARAASGATTSSPRRARRIYCPMRRASAIPTFCAMSLTAD